MLNTVDQVIRMLIAQEGYRTLHKYLPYLTHALNGLYMIKRDGAYKAKVSASLKVSSRKSVEWPKDMLFATKIGVEIGGRILTFIPDSSISLNRDDHKTSNSNLTDAGYGFVASVSRLSDFLGYTNVYYSGTTPGLNVGSLVARRFKVNEESREFQLDSTLSCKNVHIEYISTGLKPSSETLISVHSSEALKNWIWWQEGKFKFGANAAETRARKEEYFDELSESIMAQSDLSWNGIMDALSQSMSHTVDQ